jgi:hypothetical protein
MARTAAAISSAGCGHGCGCMDTTHSILRPGTGKADRSTIMHPKKINKRAARRASLSAPRN